MFDYKLKILILEEERPLSALVWLGLAWSGLVWLGLAWSAGLLIIKFPNDNSFLKRYILSQMKSTYFFRKVVKPILRFRNFLKSESFWPAVLTKFVALIYQ